MRLPSLSLPSAPRWQKLGKPNNERRRRTRQHSQATFSAPGERLDNFGAEQVEFSRLSQTIAPNAFFPPLLYYGDPRANVAIVHLAAPVLSTRPAAPAEVARRRDIEEAACAGMGVCQFARPSQGYLAHTSPVPAPISQRAGRKTGKVNY